MDARRRRSPGFDALEGRQLLSAAGRAQVAAAHVKASPSAFLTSLTQSTTHGAGGRETLTTTFSGTSTAEGTAKATSSEVAKNNALVSVQVLLKTAHGSVRLAFGPTDVTQNIASSLGSEIDATYHIVSGSGAFAGEKGTGTVSFWSLASSDGSWNLTITPTPTGS